MAYAFLAQLSPEYGLFTSFAGFAIYWVFGTSRDVVVGVSPSSATQVLCRHHPKALTLTPY